MPVDPVGEEAAAVRCARAGRALRARRRRRNARAEGRGRRRRAQPDEQPEARLRRRAGREDARARRRRRDRHRRPRVEQRPRHVRRDAARGAARERRRRRPDRAAGARRAGDGDANRRPRRFTSATSPARSSPASAPISSWSISIRPTTCRDSTAIRGAVYSQIVYAAKSTDVVDVMCDGRWLMRERRLLTLDEDDLHAAAARRGAAHRRVPDRAGAERPAEADRDRRRRGRGKLRGAGEGAPRLRRRRCGARWRATRSP